MKKELQDKLFSKYPKIFKQKDLSIKDTCMAWGIMCNDGWYFIIDELCDFIQGYIDCRNRLDDETFPQLEATQVKEKFGSLRFYYIGGDDTLQGAVHFVENLTNCICEDCGSTEDVKQTKGWIITLCKVCTDEAIQNGK